MKKILTLALAFSCGAALAQKADNVGIGTSKPDPSAILDLNSNSKGLLLPRMSEAQRNAIKNPAAGLIIFQTDQVVGTYTFDGTAWQPSSARTSVTSSTGAWDTGGNAVAASDFLGTTNGQPLRFKVANTNFGQWDPAQNGSISIGHSAGGNGSIRNIAIGASALSVASGGAGGNVALGYESLKATTSGISNMGIGAWALWKNTTGDFNTGVGAGALYSIVSGSKNTAIGTDAMLWAGAGAGGNIAIGYQAAYRETGSNLLYIANSETVNPLIKGNFANGTLRINVKPQVGGVSSLGHLAIGDFDAGTSPQMGTPTGYRLIVQDGILTEKLKVALRTDGTNWADYVFEPSYKLMSLEEVEKYTKTNKHLPNVPSADEITKEGIDVAKVSKMFMEKIEELTLHVIELNKRIKELENTK